MRGLILSMSKANENQLNAINNKNNLMIIAGPGSGKTFTMIQKIKN